MIITHVFKDEESARENFLIFLKKLIFTDEVCFKVEKDKIIIEDSLETIMSFFIRFASNKDFYFKPPDMKYNQENYPISYYKKIKRLITDKENFEFKKIKPNVLYNSNKDNFGEKIILTYKVCPFKERFNIKMTTFQKLFERCQTEVLKQIRDFYTQEERDTIVNNIKYKNSYLKEKKLMKEYRACCKAFRVKYDENQLLRKYKENLKSLDAVCDDFPKADFSFLLEIPEEQLLHHVNLAKKYIDLGATLFKHHLFQNLEVTAYYFKKNPPKEDYFPKIVSLKFNGKRASIIVSLIRSIDPNQSRTLPSEFLEKILNKENKLTVDVLHLLEDYKVDFYKIHGQNNLISLVLEDPKLAIDYVNRHGHPYASLCDLLVVNHQHIPLMKEASTFKELVSLKNKRVFKAFAHNVLKNYYFNISLCNKINFLKRFNIDEQLLLPLIEKAEQDSFFLNEYQENILEAFFRQYNDKRKVEFLCKIEFLKDTLSMLSSACERYEGEIYHKDIKSFRDIHDYLLTLNRYLKYPYKELNQEKVMKYEGLKTHGGIVWVPKSNHDLILLGDKLEICVGDRSYTNSVLRGDSHIIALKDENDNLFACISLNSRNLKVIEASRRFNAPMQFNPYVLQQDYDDSL